MSMRTPTQSAATLPVSAAAISAASVAGAGPNPSMAGLGMGGGPGLSSVAGMNAGLGGAMAMGGGGGGGGATSQAGPTVAGGAGASGVGGPAPVQQPPALLLGATFECSLSGSVHVGQFRHLYDRLMGLCEHGTSQTMFEHEIFYTPAVQRPVYPSARNDEVQLRLRVKLTPQSGPRSLRPPGEASILGRSNKKQRTNELLDAPPVSSETADPLERDPMDHLHLSSGKARKKLPQQVFTRQYQICQFGHQEPGRNLVVRSAIVVKIQGDPFTFLSLLGYTFEDEYVRIGHNFVYNNTCRISVFRQYKLERQHDPLSILRPSAEPGSTVAHSASATPNTTSAAVVQQQQQQQSGSGASTPVSSANATPMSTPLLGSAGGPNASMPTSTLTPTQPTMSTDASGAGSAAATPNPSTVAGGATGSTTTTPSTSSASSVVEPPWMIEIHSAFVTQENVNAMSEEINNVRALLSGSVKFN